LFTSKKVCVVGLGYIGLPTATILASRGYQVLGVEFGPALSGIAGLGHIVMSLGLVGITVTLGSSVFASSKGKN
jgi:NADPH-dependent 2,4-dienoyl-CoA reductase/sulfur reductase-like enzyme